MTTKSATDVLSAPLDSTWTLEGLAERLLSAVAEQPTDFFVLDGAEAMDRQARRLIRPLVACLATMSAAESGTPCDIYGAELSFERTGPNGPVWIFGRFKNTQGEVRVELQSSMSPPESFRGTLPAGSVLPEGGRQNKTPASVGGGDTTASVLHDQTPGR